MKDKQRITPMEAYYEGMRIFYENMRAYYIRMAEYYRILGERGALRLGVYPKDAGT